MKFCEVCDNMLYIRLTGGGAGGAGESSQLKYACINCGSQYDGGGTCVMDTNYVDDQTTYKQHANRFLTHDPTLPRVDNIPCPNAACTRPAEAGQEVIYVKYDYADLKFLYHCVHCGTFWKSGGNRT